MMPVLVLCWLLEGPLAQSITLESSPPPCQGDTAVYLLYAHARIAAILRKSGKDVAELAKSTKITLGNDLEVALALHVSRFSGAFSGGEGWHGGMRCCGDRQALPCGRGAGRRDCDFHLQKMAIVSHDDLLLPGGEHSRCALELPLIRAEAVEEMLTDLYPNRLTSYLYDLSGETQGERWWVC